MNPFREMILLSLHEYKRFRKQILYNQPTEADPSMQKELHELKEKYGDEIPADQRQKLESSIISKHTGYNKGNTGVIETPPDLTTQNELFLHHFDNFSNVNKKRAQQMFHHLKETFKHKPIWNDLGQLINFQTSNPIQGSNIVDLIDSVTNTRRTNTVPSGWQSFIHYLNISNMPRNFLSLIGINKLEIYKHSGTNQDSSVESARDINQWEQLR